VAPPPSPVAYVAMGSVNHDHFLQLEEHLAEDEQPTFSMDDVSVCSLCSCSIYDHTSSYCLSHVEVRVFRD
jgi:hypothetical protein